MLNNNMKSRPSSPPTSAGTTSTPNRTCSRHASPSIPSPYHPFLQSPTHARSNSASTSSSSSQSHSAPRIASPTLPTRTTSPEPFSPTLMSFASGYNPHQHSSATATVAKPIAIYPQDHPQLKRFSPRYSASGASYTTYTTALASTIHQQQQIQMQRRSYHHHDGLDKYGEHVSDHSPSHAPGNQFITRNQIGSSHNGYSSPPSPCIALDASSCHCTRQHSMFSSSISTVSAGASNSSAISSPSLSVVSAKSSSVLTEDHSMSPATSMTHCSPILSHAITALLPDVVQIAQPVSSTNNNKIISGTLADPSSPLDSPISPPSSGFSSTRASSVSSPPPTPARSSRTSSMVSESSSLLIENMGNGYFSDPCVSSPSPSPPLAQLNGLENQQMHKQRHPKHQGRRRHARQSLTAIHGGGDQSAYLIDSCQPPRQMQASSALTVHPRHRHHSNHSSSHSSKSLAHETQPQPPPPNSPQAIALSSSRYIRFLWLPLLPLLILAVGGQTSAKFESPVTYTV